MIRNILYIWVTYSVAHERLQSLKKRDIRKMAEVDNTSPLEGKYFLLFSSRVLGKATEVFQTEQV